MLFDITWVFAFSCFPVLGIYEVYLDCSLALLLLYVFDVHCHLEQHHSLGSINSLTLTFDFIFWLVPQNCATGQERINHPLHTSWEAFSFSTTFGSRYIYARLVSEKLLSILHLLVSFLVPLDCFIGPPAVGIGWICQIWKHETDIYLRFDHLTSWVQPPSLGCSCFYVAPMHCNDDLVHSAIALGLAIKTKLELAWNRTLNNM